MSETEPGGASTSADAGSTPLVRPYVSDAPTPPDRTWSASAAPSRFTVPRPASSTPPRTAVADPPRARRSLILLAAIGGLAIAATAIGFGLPGDDDHSTAAPGVSGPGLMANTAPVVPPLFSASPSPSSTPSSPSTSTSTSPPPATHAPATRAPATTATSPPPRADRIVTILSGARDCLDLNGGVTTYGHHIQVAPCNGTDAQIWTLSADGTLRVKGTCAQETADTTVRVTGCRSDRTLQWRTGTGRSIVNAATGDCLALPPKDPVEGHALIGATCDGGTGQRWTVS